MDGVWRAPADSYNSSELLLGSRPGSDEIKRYAGSVTSKVLFVSYELVPGGGGSVVASWMLQALVSTYEVTTLTWEPLDLAALDRKFGTSLAGSPIGVLTPSLAEQKLVNCIPDGSGFQQINYLIRMAKRHASEFDLLVACGNETDFGRPGIQYLHYPYLDRRSEEWTDPHDETPSVRLRGLLSGRLPPWMLISGFSFGRMRHNLTLTNSRWTAREMGSSLAAEVLYPPAPGDFVDIPWTQRKDAFICTARIVSCKRQDWIAGTLALVRREWPGLQLHICGSSAQAEYLKLIEQRAKEHGPWVQLHLGLSRKDLIVLLSECRYGIHASIDEHFGIAPAEMARAGCIPFVHSSGGQVEIVDRDPRLCYTTAEDAAAKILAVLRDASLQDELRTTVRQRSERFTSEAFTRGFLAHVAKFMSEHRG